MCQVLFLLPWRFVLDNMVLWLVHLFCKFRLRICPQLYCHCFLRCGFILCLRADSSTLITGDYRYSMDSSRLAPIRPRVNDSERRSCKRVDLFRLNSLNHIKNSRAKNDKHTCMVCREWRTGVK